MSRPVFALLAFTVWSLGSGAHVARVAAQGTLKGVRSPNLLSAEEFARQPPDRRRQVMNAWALGAPEPEAPAILPLLDAGLRDTDFLTREDALLAVQKVLAAAAVERARGSAGPSDVKPYLVLRPSLKALLADSNLSTRRRAVTALATFGDLIDRELEGEFIRRLASEPAEFRAVLIDGIAASARQGSATARAALLDALDDDALTVKLRVIAGLRGASASTDVPALKAALARERSARVRAELQRLIASLSK